MQIKWSKGFCADPECQTLRGPYLRVEWYVHWSYAFLCSAHSPSEYAHNDTCPMTKGRRERGTENGFVSFYKWLQPVARCCTYDMYHHYFYLYLFISYSVYVYACF